MAFIPGIKAIIVDLAQGLPTGVVEFTIQNPYVHVLQCSTNNVISYIYIYIPVRSCFISHSRPLQAFLVVHHRTGSTDFSQA